jgi:hypothetical protein
MMVVFLSSAKWLIPCNDNGMTELAAVMMNHHHVAAAAPVEAT